jgi:hypothetical protein
MSNIVGTTDEQSEAQPEPELSNEIYAYLVSKLQVLRHRRGFGRIELKIQDGEVHTMHFTESVRAPKRRRAPRVIIAS